MDKLKVEVKEFSTGGKAMVILHDVNFQVSTIGGLSLYFFVDEDTADSLQFHLGSALQELERQKDLYRDKCSEELRDMQPLEKEQND